MQTLINFKSTEAQILQRIYESEHRTKLALYVEHSCVGSEKWNQHMEDVVMPGLLYKTDHVSRQL